MNFACILPQHKIYGLAMGLALTTAAPAAAQTYPTLLPGDTETRQAIAIAASVVPPEQVTTDIVRLAGEYSYGNGFDRNYTLEISPDGRFLYKLCNCETIIDQARGKVALESGQVVLQPERPRESWPAGMGQILQPVTWDQRLYLVPQNDILGFSNQVNRGIEPVNRGSMGSYFLREGDWDRPAEGQPDLPDESKELLLERPLTGMVAGKDPTDRWIINLGQDHGIFNGMELSAWAADLRRFVTIVVTETGTSTSAVQIVGPSPAASIQGWTVYSRVIPPGQQPAEKR